VLAGGVIPGAVMHECGCGRYGRHDRSQSSLNAKGRLDLKEEMIY
jgi:hypothetical protein